MPSPSHDVHDNRAERRFEIDLGDGDVAFAQYVLAPGQIIFTHTKVPRKHEGQGYGTALVKAALASARERGLTVVPRCPFFADYFDRHPQEQDLLKAQ